MGSLFINPWLLGGLALALAPVIIHIFNKRRFRIHEWAAMDFLFQAAVHNRRRVRFEDVILLLLRTLIIAFAIRTASSNSSSFSMSPPSPIFDLI